MYNLKKLLIALIAMLTLYGVEVRAQSSTTTNVQGVVYVHASRDGGPPTGKFGPILALTGPGLSVANGLPSGGDPGNVEARDTCRLMPCTPGQVVGTNSSFSGLLAWSLPSVATATVNGVRYWNVRITGSLNFVSSPIVIPNFGVGTSVVTIPFTFTGELRIDALQPDVVNPVFTGTLSGQGMASFHFWLVGFDTSNPRYWLDFIEYRFGPFPISIDIKPDSFPNTINPRSKGKIPVAILTTDSFDATAVDPATVLFGAAGNEVAPVHWATEDVDGDSDIDLVLHFVTQDTGITCGNASASLTGATFSGAKIKGTESIEPVGCN